jgi:hypothetical protein
MDSFLNKIDNVEFRIALRTYLLEQYDPRTIFQIAQRYKLTSTQAATLFLLKHQQHPFKSGDKKQKAANSLDYSQFVTPKMEQYYNAIKSRSRSVLDDTLFWSPWVVKLKGKLHILHMNLIKHVLKLQTFTADQKNFIIVLGRHSSDLKYTFASIIYFQNENKMPPFNVKTYQYENPQNNIQIAHLNKLLPSLTHNLPPRIKNAIDRVLAYNISPPTPPTLTTPPKSPNPTLPSFPNFDDEDPAANLLTDVLKMLRKHDKRADTIPFKFDLQKEWITISSIIRNFNVLLQLQRFKRLAPKVDAMLIGTRPSFQEVFATIYRRGWIDKEVIDYMYMCLQVVYNLFNAIYNGDRAGNILINLKECTFIDVIDTLLREHNLTEIPGLEDNKDDVEVVDDVDDSDEIQFLPRLPPQEELLPPDEFREQHVQFPRIAKLESLLSKASIQHVFATTGNEIKRQLKSIGVCVYPVPLYTVDTIKRHAGSLLYDTFDSQHIVNGKHSDGKRVDVPIFIPTEEEWLNEGMFNDFVLQKWLNSDIFVGNQQQFTIQKTHNTLMRHFRLKRTFQYNAVKSMLGIRVWQQLVELNNLQELNPANWSDNPTFKVVEGTFQIHKTGWPAYKTSVARVGDAFEDDTLTHCAYVHDTGETTLKICPGTNDPAIVKLIREISNVNLLNNTTLPTNNEEQRQMIDLLQQYAVHVPIEQPGMLFWRPGIIIIEGNRTFAIKENTSKQSDVFRVYCDIVNVKNQSKESLLLEAYMRVNQFATSVPIAQGIVWQPPIVVQDRFERFAEMDLNEIREYLAGSLLGSSNNDANAFRLSLYGLEPDDLIRTHTLSPMKRTDTMSRSTYFPQLN